MSPDTRVAPRGAALAAATAAVAAGAACGAAAWLHPDILTLNLDWSPAMAVAMAAGLALLVAAFRSAVVGACAILALAWSNLSEVLVRVHDLPSALQLLLPLVVLAVLVRRVAQPSAPRTPGLPPLLLFAGLALAHVGVVLLSVTWAAEPDSARRAAEEAAKAAVLGLAVAALIDDARAWRLGAWTVVAVAAALAALSSWQALRHDWSITFGGLARVKQAFIAGTVHSARSTGPLSDPNFWAQALLVLVPVALALGLGARTARGRMLAFGAAALLGLGVATTYSRGGALALGVVLALVTWQERGRVRRRHVPWLAAGVALLLVAAPGLFLSRLGTLSVLLPSRAEGLQAHDSSVDKRRVLMGAAAAMAIDHPLLGLGAGTYGDHFDEYADRVGAAARIYQEPGERAFAHSLYLEILAETGLVGLAAFLCVAGGALLLTLGAARRFVAAGDAASAILARGVAIGIVGYLVSSALLHGDYIRYLWVLLGLGIAGARVARALPAQPRPGSA